MDGLQLLTFYLLKTAVTTLVFYVDVNYINISYNISDNMR